MTLEGIERNLRLPLDATKSHVALISLYSWTYLCLPPDEGNFVDAMRSIGDQIKLDKCWLRSPDELWKPLLAAPGSTQTPTVSLKDRLARRMQDGYVLQRYLLQSGEETVSFYRGPLTPTYAPPIPRNLWPFQSNFSSDYQILDRKLGIVDISYSAAWQLGQTLGIADQSFTAALIRLRGSIQTTARRKAKQDVSVPGATKSKAATLSTMAASLNTISKLSAAAPGKIVSDPSNRFVASHLPPPVFDLEPASFTSVLSTSAPPSSPGSIQGVLFNQHAAIASAVLASGRSLLPADATAVIASAKDDDLQDEVYIPFNEINVPNNTDWQIVQTWILSNMYLKKIPAHYLIPDPSFLQRETIRFFYIDSNWMDAFIDGA